MRRDLDEVFLFTRALDVVSSEEEEELNFIVGRVYRASLVHPPLV